MLEPGDEVAFCWPRFPVYRINATKMGAVPVAAGLAQDGSSYDLDALLAGRDGAHEARLRDESQQPDGRHGRAVMRSPPSSTPCPSTCCRCVDEAYFEYIDDPDYPDTLREHVLAGRRVGVLRTFSKIYGLAGLRVGYGIFPADVAAACVKVKNAFDVAQVAQDAALASLGQDAELARRRREMIAGRALLCDGLRAHGLEPLATVANFATSGSATAPRWPRRSSARG